MGQKVHPTGIRLGIIKKHTSVWFAERTDYSNKLNDDLRVRELIRKRLKNASVSAIDIERPSQSAKITIHTARPGIVIGKKGEDVDRIRNEIKSLMGVPIQMNIQEIRKPELDALLAAHNVASQLERRVMFRRAMKRAMQNAMRAGAKGVRIQVSGRLGGAEIARKEWYREGRVPLHTLRADIDYATAQAHTTYGVIGVKVWIFKGEVLNGMQVVENNQEEQLKKPAARRPRKKPATKK
ncbi:MAG: 30S ribosomal protein S3 [Endozoicomonadaceae bacterium]|nr:30S ribosomal protein S3 [Endozoicomonadaceae bacterium]